MSNLFLAKIILLYLFLFCNNITSKKLRSPGFETVKLSECGRCKVLTESFNHWLEKTARGKYEGGDAAWEETKLKSYARSEVRLVEVQEGLCSELKKNQDDCYLLAEDADHVLEKWWFHEDPNSVDLHTWLCIEQLQYCCPINHFGHTCMPCPLDRENKICSGQGTCDGDGTRNGNGTCICKRGYTGRYCEECAQNFYSKDGSCEQCHRSCSGCSGQGSAACVSCKSGWQMESGVCIDIDECSTPSRCKSHQYCVNREGSFKCAACDVSCKTCNGAGTNNCTSCDSTDLLLNGMCLSQKLKNGYTTDTLKRFGLYLGLLLITLFVYRVSKHLASVVILIISMYVYISEKSLHVNSLDVVSNILF